MNSVVALFCHDPCMPSVTNDERRELSSVTVPAWGPDDKAVTFLVPTMPSSVVIPGIPHE